LRRRNRRHAGAIGADSLDAADRPDRARRHPPAGDLPLPAPRREHEALADLKAIAGKNVVNKSCIGMGYYDTLTPKVILRNVMENPGWYTAYTPYQAEIAQGRLEALLNYQQMVIDLTGLEIANASLLDEATAAAEAMTMARRGPSRSRTAFRRRRPASRRPSTWSRPAPATSASNWSSAAVDEAAQHEEFLRRPASSTRTTRGEVRDLTDTIASLKAKGARRRRRLRPDGAGAAQVAGRDGRRHRPRLSQRFGVPMGFGGPHAAFFATREARPLDAGPHHRRLQGCARQDRLRMALQTREQHIRREKANSNICTSQVLLANMAGMYAVYHGPQGLRTIAGASTASPPCWPKASSGPASPC
jgi:glycine dehydrogenase